MKIKLLSLLFICVFVFALFFKGAYSAWISTNNQSSANNVQFEVPNWAFNNDFDLARIGYLSSSSYLTVSEERRIVNNSAEAIRLTNTAGTQSKDHSVTITTDRDYLLGEIRFFKLEFDYYHSNKREQSNKGFPSIQLLYNNTKKGSLQGGSETVNEKSSFIVTEINEDWWHLEYFITALAPTMVDHGDTALSLSTKINGIQIVDKFIYDYNSNTAFAVIDNLRFSAEPVSRLGLFNRTTTCSVNGYYWVKVAWVGELQSVQFIFSDPSIAEHDLNSTKSPFYIKGLSAGTTLVTAIVTLNTGQILSISNKITVS